MPLARIITRYPEHTSDLSQQLQIEGFSVEIVSPEDVPLQPADLEIDFAICNPADVLQRAARRASELGADVVVASGVLDLAIEPPSVELQPSDLAEIHAQPQSIPEQPVLANAVPIQPATLQSNQSVPDQPAEEQFSHELPAYNPHFAANLGTQLRESLNGLGVAATELTKRIVEHLRTAGAGSRIAAIKANHAQIASPDAEAVTQSADLQIAQPQQEPVQETQRELAAEAIPPQLPAPTKRSKIPPRRRRQLQLRGIFTGAAAASVLFIVGMVLASVHPQSPLPAGMTQPVEQHVPFGAIIVQGKPVQGTSAKPAASVIQPKIVSPRTNLQPSENNQPPVHKKPHPYRARRAAQETEDDVTADDVVVRHFPTQVKRPPAQQQARLKRYSDLN